MFGWQRKKPVTGPRLKSYSGASGYVYEYAFTGQREHPVSIEYLFNVTWDRKTFHEISVWITEAAIEPWVSGNQRELRSNERYAIAKMALRNAFDERQTPEAILEGIAPGVEEVNAILDELGV